MGQGPRVAGWQEIAREASRQPERVEHLSPDGRFRLVHESTGEWHMGVEGWKLSLFEAGDDVTPKPLLRRGRGFRSPGELAPWSADSSTLCLLDWEAPEIVVYDVASNQITRPRLDGFALGLRWSPQEPLLLAVFEERLVLLDPSGETLGVVDWPTGPLAFARWWPSGAGFFAIGRPAGSAKIQLGFFGTDPLALESSVDLDPEDLLPYDAERYRDVPRGPFSLRFSSTSGGVGALLDRWSVAEFRPELLSLDLATYRPTAAPRLERDLLVCQAEQRWVRVRLEG